MSAALTGAMALGFALVHVFIGTARFLDVLPRSRWLSAAGGAAAAYVFLHVLPELAGHQQTFREALPFTGRAEVIVYCIALVGLTVFYGLERVIRVHKHRVQSDHPLGRALKPLPALPLERCRLRGFAFGLGASRAQAFQ